MDDRVNLRPTQDDEALTHGVLQRAALSIVQNLVRRRLPHIEDGFALEMVSFDLVRHHHAWLVSFMTYDLGYIDLEQKTLQTIDNPFGSRLSPMS